MAKNSAASLLTSVDSLFTTQEERDIASQPRVQEIPVDKIDDFPNHPFKVRMDDNMIEMAESVKQHGILVPAIVRPKENGHYEMVAGHRRKLACTLIAKLQLPCIVRELTDEEATIIMVDSNLQREQLLPSEKAFAYKMKLDAMKRQGQRNDLTLSPMATKFDAAAKLGQQSGESRDQVFRYIRLTNLIPEVLDLVDNSVLKEKDKLQIALRPAVELSYLTEQEQHDLYETMTTEDCTPSHVQAMKMRKFSEEGRLNIDVIFSIMQEEKPNQKEQFKIPKERISKFFAPGTPAQKIEDTSENPQTVTVKAGETAGVSFTNALRPGRILIEKVDIRGEPLADAKFLLEWSKDGSLWWPVEYTDAETVREGFCFNAKCENGVLTSGKDGLLEWTGLHPGLMYRVTELEAPKGYSLLTEPAFDGTLPADILTVSFRVVNCEIFKLPDTGMTSGAWLRVSQFACIFLCTALLVYSYRKERRQ